MKQIDELILLYYDIEEVPIHFLLPTSILVLEVARQECEGDFMELCSEQD